MNQPNKRRVFNLRRSTPALITLCAVISTGTAALADEGASAFSKAVSETRPILDLRIRYESVDQDGIAETADAVTTRVRAGFETGQVFDTSLLIDFEWIESIVDDFNSTINGKTMYPVVADPDATELNRLQLTNTSIPGTTVTLGRQRIILDDARFVGNVGWRQNEQTFDAFRVVNASISGLKLDAAYINQVNRIFGDDSPVGRFEGDVVIANAGYTLPFGSVAGFAYLLDLEDAPALSSKTLGVRASASTELGAGRATLTASYAAQSDYADNPTSYDEDYYLVEGSYAISGFSIGAGYEVLTGDGTIGFSTPLATLHKFQGWADKFLTTPADGIEDLYFNASYTLKDVSPFDAIKLAAIYHDYSSENTSADLGSEVDLLAKATLNDVSLTVKYADYDADGFATDTEKLWLSVDFSI